MKGKLIEILRDIVGEGVSIDLSIPEDPTFGHFSTNIAMRLAKQAGKRPIELAEEIVIAVQKAVSDDFLEKVEAASPGFVNFWMSKKTLQDELLAIVDVEDYGANHSMDGKTVMIEFTDPNPFKLFHIGHLMSNTIGESLARLYEAAGAKTLRVNYQGDTGIHIAMAVWAMQNVLTELPVESATPLEKVEYLGRAYAAGSKAYRDESLENKDKDAIVSLNEKIFARSDAEVNRLYDLGRSWSLAYFETIYARLGTKFAHYFFESEVGSEGVRLILSYMNVFAESESAIIFPGEQYGLHTRVFINSKGLPTYEAKELGLNKKKFELYDPNLSIIVTGNEIIDYFRVLLKAMELTMPEVARHTRHVPHGMLRLPTGKMSSRTGDVITAESMIDQVKERIMQRISEKSDLDPRERETVAEATAVGAIKYSILKQNPGQDIVFDFEKSLSFEGDSGPYVQYTCARLRSILRKAGEITQASSFDFSVLASDVELQIMRKILEFSDVVALAQERYASSGIVAYVYKLASLANKFYEMTPILKDEDVARRKARLVLVALTARTIASALFILGIQAPEKI